VEPDPRDTHRSSESGHAPATFIRNASGGLGRLRTRHARNCDAEREGGAQISKHLRSRPGGLCGPTLSFFLEASSVDCCRLLHFRTRIPNIESNRRGRYNDVEISTH
jgi:hypothetical protein